MERTIQLSPRLQTIANEVPGGSRLADIGTDHARLPITLLQEGMIQGAIASDLNSGPYESALLNVTEAGLSKQIEVRHGSGLTPLVKADNINVVTIAGMGGALITEILSEDPGILPSVHTLILQPNIAAEVVRKWLYQEGWNLASEHIAEEAGHFYEIMRASRETGIDSAYEGKIIEDAWLFGPLLLQTKSDTFQKKWQSECEHFHRVLEQIDAQPQTGKIAKKRKQIEARINKIKEVLP